MATVSVALFITPNVSSEPVDQPKMTLMVPLAFAALFLLIANIRLAFRNINRWYLVSVLLFMIQLALVLIFSDAPFNQQFFGTSGRNTGFLSYLALSGLAIAAAWSSNLVLVLRMVYSLLIVGSISMFYSLLQTFAVDPVKWNNPYNSILAFLGNPNFASSFTGMCGVAAFALLLRQKLSILQRIGLGIYVLFGVFIMYRSASQQGILVLGAGSLVVALIFISSTQKLSTKLIKYSFLSFSGLASLLVVFGTLNIGPLGSHLYKISVRQRGFYWHAAKNMLINHPLFGVGLDSYGDWYFKYRSLNAAFHTPLTQSNAAHNVYLEFGSNGGFPLFILYLLIVLLTAVSAWKLIRRQSTYNWAYAGLIGAWISYQAQALISINQLGLAIWGWVFSGVIVGSEFVTRTNASQTESQALGSRRNLKSKNGDNSSLLIAGVGLVVGSILVAPVFLNDANYRKAAQTGNANLIITAALKSPEDTGRSIQTAQLLMNNKLFPQGIELVKHVLSINPRDFNAWTLLASATQPGTPDNKLANQKLKELNPQIRAK